MKALIISEHSKPHTGLGRYTKGVVNSLERMGIVVDLLAEGGHYGLLPKGSVLHIIRNCLLARERAQQFDIVHALDAWPYGVYGLFAVLGTSKKLFVGGVGTYSIPPRAFSLKRMLLLLVYRRAREVFCISHYTKQRIAERLPFKANLSVVLLASDKLPRSNLNPHDVFSIRKGPGPVFISVGALKERKGQLDTVRGLALLKNTYPHFLYLLVGSTEDVAYVAQIKQAVKELAIESNVLFLKTVRTDEELAALYMIADILFLNSNNEGDHFEGFGLVFLEANQFGVPGVGSLGCGIEDAIENGVSGMLVPQKNHQAIAQATEHILSNKEQFQEGARGWYTHFSWENTVRQYIRAYTR